MPIMQHMHMHTARSLDLQHPRFLRGTETRRSRTESRGHCLASAACAVELGLGLNWDGRRDAPHPTCARVAPRRLAAGGRTADALDTSVRSLWQGLGWQMCGHLSFDAHRNCKYT